MEVSTVETYKILGKKFTEEESEKIIAYIEAKSSMEANKDTFLTKQDKIEMMAITKQDKIEMMAKQSADKLEIITRLDNHFKWLVGIMLVAISLATVLGKLL